MENRCHTDRQKNVKEGEERVGKEEEVRGFCASLGCGIDLKQSHLASQCRRKTKQKTADTETHTVHTYTHSTTTTTTTNSWRRRQTRRELISSPTRRGLQGENERGGERDVEELFLPMCGSQACRPLIPLTLTPSSVTPNGMFLFIFLSLPPSISICRPPPCRVSPFLPSAASLHRCLHPRRCFRCVTSSQTAGEQVTTRN